MLIKALAYLSLGLALPLGLAVPLPALAQADCPYAILRVESSQYVDTDAVCAAAQSWSEAGYQVFVFLTDVRPASEEAWFTLLDGVEAEAGLRDLTQADSFAKAAIALEVTTATDLPYSVSLTYGETLYGSPLDTDEAAVEGIKRRIRDRVAAQDATWALTIGLGETADLAGVGSPNPPASNPAGNNAVALDPGAGNDLSPQVHSSRQALGRVMAGGGLVAVGGSTVLGLGLARRRRQRLQAQLATLQSRLANLLMGCEQLLTGGAPENTVSYQLFVEADGERYPALAQEVKTYLAQARTALDQAFQVHRDLQENRAHQERPLKERVAAWELLYLSFVGRRDRIRAMSDEELQTLLNPALILGKSNFSPGLTTQLESIQQQIQGQPLKVELMAVKADQAVDEEGILGRVERVDAAIGRLREAVALAPQTLQALHDRRQGWSAPTAIQFGFTEADLCHGIDQALAAADTALHQDRRYLTVLDYCAVAEQGLAAIASLDTTLQQVQTTRAAIQDLQAQGYRPPALPSQEETCDRALATLRGQLQQAQYPQVPEQATTLAQATEAALQILRTWQKRHQTNQTTLTTLAQTTAHLITRADTQAAQAWDALQALPPSNWQDLAGVVSHTQTLLARLQRQDWVTLHQQNDLAVQALDAVKAGAAQYQQHLDNAEAELQRVLDRHALVLKARHQLQGELTEIEAYIQKVTDLTRNKLLGLVPTGDIDARLQKGQGSVETARELARSQEYLRACEARDNALRLVVVVYGEKLRQRVTEVRSLVNDHRARGAGRRELAKAQDAIATDSEIRAAQGDDLFALYADANQARQAIDAAESDARRAIRNYGSGSSSGSSYRASSSSSSFGSASSSRSSNSSSSGGSSRRSSNSQGSSRRSSSSHGSSRRR